MLAWLALHAAVMLFGFAGLFGKWLSISPVLIVLGRTAIAAAALGLVRLAGGDRCTRPVPALCANGVVLAAHWLSFFVAIQLADVATGLLGFATFPLFTLLFGRLCAGVRVSASQFAAACLVVGGLAVMVPGFPAAGDSLAGLCWGVVSGASFALLALLNRRHAALRPAQDIAFWQNLCAALTLLPAVWFTYRWSPAALGTVGWRELALLAGLGVFCTALAHTLFIASLSQFPASTASIVAGLEPVYGIALAFLLLGELPSPRALVGGALIVTASFVAGLAAQTDAKTARRIRLARRR
jgi:drug/metabolite transporter (DMT)-like permease